jgi:hypothetical protein
LTENASYGDFRHYPKRALEMCIGLSAVFFPAKPGVPVDIFIALF